MCDAPPGGTMVTASFPDSMKASLARLTAAVDLAVEKRALYVSGALQMIGIDAAYIDYAAGTYAVPAPPQAAETVPDGNGTPGERISDGTDEQRPSG